MLDGFCHFFVGLMEKKSDVKDDKGIFEADDANGLGFGCLGSVELSGSSVDDWLLCFWAGWNKENTSFSIVIGLVTFGFKLAKFENLVN